MDKRQRHIEKRNIVIEWLLACQMTTPRILCLVLGVERSNQSRFFNTLKNTGLFNIVTSPLVLENIWILSSEGFKYSDLYFNRPEGSFIKPSKVVTSTAIHSFCVQVALTRRLDMVPPLNFRFDKFISNIAKGKRPDAIFDKGGKLVALEVELTQKSNKRIYMGFLEQIENMKAGYYQSVEYIFPSEALKKAYLKRFDEGLWPDLQKDKFGKIKQKSNLGEMEFINVDNSRIKKLFSFMVEELY